MGAGTEGTIRDIPGMDAATRAELHALRARAYGRDADIGDDPAAIARLEELERLARGEALRPAAGETSSPSTPAPVPSAAGTSGETPPPGVPTPAAVSAEAAEPKRPARLRAALIAGIAAVVLLIGGIAAASALQSAPEPEASEYVPPSYGLAAGAVVLMKLPLDSQFGAYGTPPDDDPPAFPVQGRVRWADSLGEYFGGELWIGGVASGAEMLCIVLVLDGGPQGSCEQRERWQRGALFLAVDDGFLDPEDRPAGLEPDESLGFWWAPDNAVYIVRGPDTLIEGGTVGASAPVQVTVEAPADPVQFAPPADALLLRRVPVEGVFGASADRTIDDPPRVPALWEVQWARAIGEHYGLDVWLANAEVDGEDRVCVVVAGDGGAYVKSACGPPDGWGRGGVYVSLPYSQLKPAERPDGLAAGARIGFWWTPDDTVWVLGGGSRPAGAFG